MLREKGYFRKGRKVGARSNLHNFRHRYFADIVVEEPEVVKEPVKTKKKKKKK